MKGKGVVTSLTFIIIVCALVLVASCSGPGSSPRGQKTATKTEQPKAAPAAPAPKAQQAVSTTDWVAFGLDKEGSTISYDRKTIQRPTERKAVGFWLLVTPLKDSKVLTEAREQLKKEEKDYRSLTSLKMLCEANCEAGTYDVSKMLMVKADGAPISEQDAGIRDRKPTAEIKTLIDKLCSGVAPGPLPKGSPQSAQATCERAGVMVLIQPRDAIAAGAKWRIEGGEWKASGEKVCNLPVDAKSGKGSYQVEYKDIAGSAYATPEPHNAIVSAESTYSFYNTEYVIRQTAQKR